jgi:CRISPR/Cas system-associated exonuclease Cas4 (RecB family)
LSSHSLETYLTCPRRYYYEHVLVLSGSDEANPYLKFQSALHTTISWIRSVASPEEREDGLAARFEDDWIRFGPSDHPFEPVYRSVAEKMLKTAISIMEGDCLGTERQVQLATTSHVIRCRADHVEITTKGIVIRRLKTSTLAKKEDSKPRYALWQAAVLNDHPGQECMFEHVSLLDGERRPSRVDPAEVQEQLQVFDEAIAGITAGRFDPKPHNWCPNCAYYFICPSHGVTL